MYQTRLVSCSPCGRQGTIDRHTLATPIHKPDKQLSLWIAGFDEGTPVCKRGPNITVPISITSGLQSGAIRGGAGQYRFAPILPEEAPAGLESGFRDSGKTAATDATT